MKETDKLCEMCGKPLTEKEVAAGMICCQECEDRWNND